jgi:hypothetical protein
MNNGLVLSLVILSVLTSVLAACGPSRQKAITTSPRQPQQESHPELCQETDADEDDCWVN